MSATEPSGRRFLETGRSLLDHHEEAESRVRELLEWLIGDHAPAAVAEMMAAPTELSLNRVGDDEWGIETTWEAVIQAATTGLDRPSIAVAMLRNVERWSAHSGAGEHAEAAATYLEQLPMVRMGTSVLRDDLCGRVEGALGKEVLSQDPLLAFLGCQTSVEPMLLAYRDSLISTHDGIEVYRSASLPYVTTYGAPLHPDDEGAGLFARPGSTQESPSPNPTL